MKMALRLRKDVQKASYYVWFLGAQEAKGLRGSKILLPAIPRLLERARIQEPLKVTLQISHKGLKIIQGSTKHFIPHGAITCSVQTEDIVACVLLLYNPATKCPLHVHAYRCDSEQTATALNEQLQILVNRPENQKRFNELESRLGYQVTPHAQTKDVVAAPPKPKQSTRRYESPRRFDSSLGSDTGTSTRESECSEEHSPPTASPPTGESTKLFDSLAAELRAKLNGNGPPLLLPPRDYDTVHRSQGNLAAIELRRCRNSSIVGQNLGKTNNQKQVVSSRGSSGIGSDLAPSPERHDGQTSSDEDWVNDHQESVIIMPASQTRHKKIVEAKQAPPERKYKEPASSYIYPREQHNEIKPQQTRYQRSSSRDGDTSPGGEEEEVKPVLMKQVPMEKRFRDVFKLKDYVEERRKYSSDEDRIFPDDRRNEPKEVYKKQTVKPTKYSREMEYRGNKTDKQKFRELSEQRYTRDEFRDEEFGERAYRSPPERTKSLKRYENRRDQEERDEQIRYRNRSSEPTRYRDMSPDDYRGRNPYRQPEATPYQESIEKMMKSPVMRYKSFEDQQPRYEKETSEKWESMYPEPKNTRRAEDRQRMIIEHMTPDSTLQKASPRDRFQNAKEKFQAMEQRERLPNMKKPEAQKHHHTSSTGNQRKSVERFESLPNPYPTTWSSDEEVPMTRNSYKELPATNRYPGLDRDVRDPPGRMLPAKSLGSLVKGYRHSYAEPRNFPRTGRVGLAAVNPY